MNDLVIVGAGGHGREVLGTVAALNADHPRWTVRGFVDDAPTHTERVERLGLRILGGVDDCAAFADRYALGIGTSATRRMLVERLAAQACGAVSVVHPDAWIGDDVRLGDGVVVFARCTITTNVSIGRHTHLNVGCAVQHDAVVGDFVQMSPGVLVNGDCRIGDDTFLGSGAVVTRGVRIGRRARIGAGAVVLNDVADDTTVVGTPARPVARR